MSEHRGRGVVAAGLAFGTLAGACAALIDLDPYRPSDAAGDASTIDGAGSADAGGDGSVAPGVRVCRGLVFYVRFDQDYDPQSGGSPKLTGPSSLVPGKFKNALSVDAGKLEYPSDAAVDPAIGTLSAWVRPRAWPPCNIQHELFELALAGGGGQVGPKVSCLQGEGVSIYDAPASAKATLPESAMVRGQWNHLMLAWERAAQFLEARVVRAGASPPVASSQPWQVDDGGVMFEIGSVSGNDPMLDLDDLAIWNRVLTDAEIADVHAIGEGGTSLGQLCFGR